MAVQSKFSAVLVRLCWRNQKTDRLISTDRWWLSSLLRNTNIERWIVEALKLTCGITWPNPLSLQNISKTYMLKVADIHNQSTSKVWPLCDISNQKRKFPSEKHWKFTLKDYNNKIAKSVPKILLGYITGFHSQNFRVFEWDLIEL